MKISLSEILLNDLFKNTSVLAGRNGLYNPVNQISVFDCPCGPDILERNIIRSGDLFITCLEQFRSDKDKTEITFYFKTLIKARCSGLLIISADRINLITADIIRMCNEANFPLILIPEDYPYAVVIATINRYLSFDTYNTINRLKLEKIMYEDIGDSKKIDVIHSIKATVKRYVRAMIVKGQFKSSLSKKEIQKYFFDREEDIYVETDDGLIIMLSSDDEKQLKRYTDTCMIRLQENMDNPVIGYSRIFELKKVGSAFDEAGRAFETAKVMNMTIGTYDALSTMQLLSTIKDTQEAEDYYNMYVDTLRSKIGKENLKEMIITIEKYVANSGNFKLTAQMLNQHENTIRYRVNRVKSVLNMENDTIKFNETIAVVSKLRILLGKEV